ncbi:MAG: saccharopine dehydrogenase NADP-binding domain-containing protein [Syntrophaceae bacterium]|nr:saccharopine dehydrogenase NADP-binding domain-containing protein [Syntrophaceae bacterium]
MKVLALGACGGMGRYAAKTLVTQKWCDKIFIADIDGKRAEVFTRELGDLAEPLALDISDSAALDAAAAGADLVMNTVGPFFRFGLQVLNSCIRTRKNYVDICDDWEITIPMLELHEKARVAGITAIIGLGTSPGISNMLAKKALMNLDLPKEIFTVWDIDAAKTETIMKKASAAAIHGLHQLTGKIKLFENGKYIDAAPISPVDLDFPGIGIRRVYTIGHPESVTFPRYYQALKTSKNVFIISRLNLVGLKLIAWMVNHGFLSVESAAGIAEKIEGPAKSGRTNEKMLAEFSREKNPKLPPLFALAAGMRKGRPATSVCAVLSAPPGGMGGATGVPLAIGAMMILKKVVTEYGVFAPEGIIDPDMFFHVLAPLCVPKKENIDELVLTRVVEK